MDGNSNDGIATDNTEKLDENGKLAQDFAGNNWSYGNEVEYILSGSDNETNKARLEAVLYFIRYAFNFALVYEHYWDDGFQMSKAKTFFQIDTKVRIKPMMVAFPYGVQYGTGSLLDTDTWNTFTYKTVEGY